MTKKHIIYFVLLFFLAGVFPAAAQTDSGSSIISAVESMQEGKHAQAEDILKSIISQDRKCDAAWYYLGVNYIYQKDADMAEECFKAAVKLDSTNFWYRERLAHLYEVTSRPAESIVLYEKLLEDFPKKSELYFDIISLYVSAGEYDRALETIKEIETVFGATESLAIYRFNLLIRLQREKEAYDSLREYNSRYSSPYVLSALADHHLAEYNDSLAVKYYDEALELAPDYAPALLGKAEVMRITRRYDDYFTILDGYLSLPEESASSKVEYMGEMLRRMDPGFIRKYQSRFDKAMDTASATHPTDSLILNLVGLYQYSTGRREEACATFRKNMQEHPQSYSAANALIEVLFYSQKWEEVSEEGQKAYENFPQHPTFLEMAIIAQRSLGQDRTALDLCDRIISTTPADSAIVVRTWATKGDIYYQLKEPKKAFKAYETALKSDPDYIYVLNNYAYFLSEERKSLKKAHEMSRKTIEAEPDNATYLDTFGWILYLMGKPQDALTHFKRAMLYGGKDSPVILDHYAEVLFALKEYDRAMVYWNKALLINNDEIKGLEAKVEKRKEQISKAK